MNEISSKNVNAALEVCKALADAIRALGSVPSGELYAHVMGKMSLGSYQAAIGALVRSGLITNDGHLLVWVG